MVGCCLEQHEQHGDGGLFTGDRELVPEVVAESSVGCEPWSWGGGS